ncbi:MULTISPECIES: sigma-70 family RNA polymerase sigma factor [Actinoalloteichus]|uniref:RNA polymerase sigma factor, sigma-70 family n=1 Tax=Actinoalloteichus fjordicus TaxID=1612552 RepID=A0AAC9PUQ7_9PSEU|nr:MULTISPECIES: sigma-70 family RNA polymerase sigma factor [Actinoalloteichus]APU17362.1 RNA polymerase sigma factor, sigma-70 family [Actinoalloteichus fjordicus]APU23446.1 RNA polymerase sigma factor, sigma-70 family [Actinoalloteichus sp. GBA129-24]
MAIVSSELPEPTDQELIEAVRAGSVEAYGSLYERHVSAAYNLARQLARSPAEQDDFVSDAFSKVLDRLRTGNGPDVAFRAYLLTALRHAAYDRTRKERRVEVSDDVASVPGVDISVPFHDTPIQDLERSLAARAFARLPERWRTVLWHMEVEGQSAATVAPLLGLTPNGVSALAYRAREGLRQAYLQVHLAETQTERCRAVVERLGSWTRGGLSKRETTQVETHLDDCARCRALSIELIDLNGTLREVGILILGAGAGGYLTAVSAGTVGGTGAAVTGTITAGAVTGAVSSAPRQWLTAAASSVALAAAVVAALLSDTAPHPVAQPTPPAVEQPAPQAPAPPDQPAPPLPSPNSPPESPPGEPTEPPPAEAPPAEESAEPVLDITTPTEPLILFAGGVAGALPVTVTNTGTAASPVVVASLDLPPGISAWIAGSTTPSATTRPVALSTATTATARTTHLPTTADDRAAAEVTSISAALTNGRPSMLPPQPGDVGRSSATAAARQSAGQEIGCTNGSGSIRCATARGLNPGESVVFDFELQAAADAQSGRVTGTIDAGEASAIELTAVSVEVRQPVDALDLAAEVGQRVEAGLPWTGRVAIRLTNTGTTTRPAEVELTAPWWFIPDGLPPECAAADSWATPGKTNLTGSQRITCRSPQPLAPGDVFTSDLDFIRALLVSGTVEVEGRLGEASRRVDAAIASPSLRPTLDHTPEVLTADGSPDALTYSVRNDGRGGSAPVEMTVQLPTGVHAEGTSGHDCLPEANVIHCRSESGVPPGAAMPFDFRVRAVDPAESGLVGGAMHAGPGTDRPLPVGRITVAEPPKLDAVHVEAAADGPWALPTSLGDPHWTYYTKVGVRTANTGDSEGPVTVTLDLPPGVGIHSWHGLPLRADAVSGQTAHLLRCRAQGEPVEHLSPTLSPGQTHDFTVRLCTSGGTEPPAPAEVAVSAALGTAGQEASVQVPWSPQWPWQHPETAPQQHSPDPVEPAVPSPAAPAEPEPAESERPAEPGEAPEPGEPARPAEPVLPAPPVDQIVPPTTAIPPIQVQPAEPPTPSDRIVTPESGGSADSAEPTIHDETTQPAPAKPRRAEPGPAVPPGTEGATPEPAMSSRRGEPTAEAAPNQPGPAERGLLGVLHR